MTQDTPNRFHLSPEAHASFLAALRNPKPPTSEAIANAKRYRDRIADGSVVVEDDDEETARWAKEGLAELHFPHPQQIQGPGAYLTPDEIEDARADLKVQNAAAVDALRAAGWPGPHPRVAALRAAGPKGAEEQPGDDQI